VRAIHAAIRPSRADLDPYPFIVIGRRLIRAHTKFDYRASGRRRRVVVRAIHAVVRMTVIILLGRRCTCNSRQGMRLTGHPAGAGASLYVQFKASFVPPSQIKLSGQRTDGSFLRASSYGKNPNCCFGFRIQDLGRSLLLALSQSLSCWTLGEQDSGQRTDGSFLRAASYGKNLNGCFEFRVQESGLGGEG